MPVTPGTPDLGPITFTAPGTSSAHQRSVWAILIAGAILVALADYAPHLVTGLLALILAGVVLKHSDRWIPWLDALSLAFAAAG